ncbi:MAG TPA: glycosyltransferase [Terriglobales bacterium]|nr:glycosyltransferase [Terriglobales bacterium]
MSTSVLPQPGSAIRLSILLPVRNEGVNLRIMIKILRAVVEVEHEILVVYDSTDDDSIAVGQELQRDCRNLRLVHNTLGRGIINALRAGVKAARGDYILIFAADEVGPVLAIEQMLQLMDQGCEFISCTRYAKGGRRLGGSLIGGILSRIANFLFHRLSASVLTDSTTGIKMFRRELFDVLKLESRPVGWVVAFEMAMKAQLAGLRMAEVPIISIDRLYGGQSTFQLGPWFRQYLRWFFWGLWHLRRGRKLPVRQNPDLSRLDMCAYSPQEKTE